MGNERGVALVVAVLVMITATFLGIAAVMTSDIEVRISGNQRVSEGAFYAADGGVDDGLAWLISNGGPTPPAELPTMNEAPHVYASGYSSQYRITDLKATGLPPPGWEMTMFEKRYYRVDSVGVGPLNAVKKIEVIASRVYPK
jgi:hypothetical protein